MYFSDGLQVGDGVEDPTLDWAAYTDSFTGLMHERETIAEWVDETVDEILEAKPKRVIEMGCGKGMILFRVAKAPYVEEYQGADLAKQALQHVERTWLSHFDAKEMGPKGHAKLSTHVRDASNFSGFPQDSYEAVVCNGVTMYFPSAAYLVDVCNNGLARCTRQGGIFHMGDVIWKQSHPLFVVRSARKMGGKSFEELQAPGVAAGLLAAAKDRVFDHNLFYELHARGMLPGVAAVEIQLKHGKIMSEFTRYRYNVLFHCADPATVGAPLPLVDALPQENAAPSQDLDAVVSAVVSAYKAANPTEGAAAGSVVCARDLLNARLSADEELALGVADTEAPAVQVGVGWGGGIDPAALRAAIAAALPGAFVLLTWPRSGQRANMDLYVMPKPLKIRGLQSCVADAFGSRVKVRGCLLRVCGSCICAHVFPSLSLLLTRALVFDVVGNYAFHSFLFDHCRTNRSSSTWSLSPT
jgi:SAM-dependent methyltransferase